ncbi:cupin domain-containing protein [Lignipirellula cremea]|uniref:Cupin domain protein n=1 Tax=Lignipirellula cremea TaxID=2528010 RepID=A0A518DQZ1_9BACT|nr:cupin domain-containing protein [Lignipirellula cremea]QDU94260.1 Cupin domain protein [Lignipirellula cremea]
MAVTHAQAGEIIDISPLGPHLHAASTMALVKTDAMEVLRLVLPAGKQIAPHAARGEITVQCLEGKVAFEARGAEHELTAGKLLYLAAAEVHALRAIEDSSLLVTILLSSKAAAKTA